jgi:hypothetical protein
VYTLLSDYVLHPSGYPRRMPGPTEPNPGQRSTADTDVIAFVAQARALCQKAAVMDSDWDRALTYDESLGLAAWILAQVADGFESQEGFGVETAAHLREVVSALGWLRAPVIIDNDSWMTQ